MQQIKTYRFFIGAKIPFSQWPELVHRFLEEQGLRSGRFFYYFEETLCGTPEENQRRLEARDSAGPCAKAQRDCPDFGEIRPDQSGQSLWLSNLDTETPFREETILPLMKKLHRWYGFSECDLYYADVDFFGRTIPTEPHPADVAGRLNFLPRGSLIHLHRDILGWNILELQLDLLEGGRAEDPTCYRDAMCALLPKVRYEEWIRLCFTEEEQETLEAFAESAKPLERRCRAFFNEKVYAFHRRNEREGKISVSAVLRKQAKKHGLLFEHNKGFDQDYLLSKRVAGGHWLQLSVDGPGQPGMAIHMDLIGFRLAFQTLGYRCVLLRTQFGPCSNEDLEAFVDHVLTLAECFELEALGGLAAAFPPCPDWFTPIPERIAPI